MKTRLLGHADQNRIHRERAVVGFVHEFQMAFAAANVLARPRAEFCSGEVGCAPGSEADAHVVGVEHDVDFVLGPPQDCGQRAQRFGKQILELVPILSQLEEPVGNEDLMFLRLI